MAFSIGIFSAKPVYCHIVSMTFDRAGVSFALNLPIENAINENVTSSDTWSCDCFANKPA